jgi:hypothetical protein
MQNELVEAAGRRPLIAAAVLLPLYPNYDSADITVKNANAQDAPSLPLRKTGDNFILEASTSTVWSFFPLALQIAGCWEQYVWDMFNRQSGPILDKAGAIVIGQIYKIFMLARSFDNMVTLPAMREDESGRMRALMAADARVCNATCEIDAAILETAEYTQWRSRTCSTTL